MQVTAFQDPITGLLFPTQELLDQFLANRKREEASIRRRKAEQEAAKNIRMLLCNELSSKEKFVELASQMYEFKLQTTKLKRNKKAPKLLEVRLLSWRIDKWLNLCVDVEVELSCSPYLAFADDFPRTNPTDVLHPFSVAGGGGADAGAGKFTYRYSMRAKLTEFPKLLEAFHETAQLLNSEDAHRQIVELNAAELMAKDATLKELELEEVAAKKAVQAANEAYQAATRRRQQRAADITAQAETASPFERAQKLAELKTVTGTGEPNGINPQWLRNNFLALLAEEKVTS